MKEGFPLLTTKKMAWKTMVTELLWFLRGDTNIKFLVDNDCHIWDGDAWTNYKRKTLENFKDDTTIAGYAITNKEDFINNIKTDGWFAKQWGELGPIYGKQWRSWDGIDQIQNLINELKTNPDSRRLMVNAWNVGELDQMVLPPCHYGFQVYTRELSHKERFQIHSNNPLSIRAAKNNAPLTFEETNTPTRAISLMWNQRSVDTFLGLPFNISSYALLLEIIAKEVDMVPDQLISSLGDVHLYSNHVDQAKEQISREPFELPTLKIESEVIRHPGNLPEYSISDFTLQNYKSHPSIKAPLSN
jgi:thymidylate synthase